jgi:hypothetical protein
VIRVAPGAEALHKKIITYAAVAFIALDGGLTLFNHVRSGSSDTAPAASAEPVYIETGLVENDVQGGEATPKKVLITVASRGNPELRWYERYFCRGYRISTACDDRPLRATTSLDDDPAFSTPQKAADKPAAIVHQTIKLDPLDRQTITR